MQLEINGPRKTLIVLIINRGPERREIMKLHEFIDTSEDGCACFSILPYCEEYEKGIDQLKREKWYQKIRNRIVKRIVTIGGGVYKVETCIELYEELNSYSEISGDEINMALERLRLYENTGLAPDEILTGAQLAEIACMQIRYKKMQGLLEQAAECIENCYGRETELSEAIKKELN